MADADTLRDPAVASRAPLTPEPSPEGAPSQPRADDARVMSLVDHLAELRDRLIRIVLVVALASILGFVFSDQIIAVLKAPIPGGEPLYYTGLGDAFVIKLKVAVVVGVILSMPVILYQVWAFVAPGLTADERRTIRPWIPLTLLFFAGGTALAYFVLPYAAAFLIGFSTADLQPLITASAYFDFVTTMFLAFGLIMEFPILLYGLSTVGIVTSERLRSARRVAILAMAVFSAGVTPGGDMVSFAAMLLTLYVLYEGTVFAIRRSGR